MNKELEALERLSNHCRDYVSEDEDYEIIENGLKKLEKYELLLNKYKIDKYNFEDICYTVSHYPCDFLTFIAKNKALEIIKKKGVDVSEIMIQNTLYAYNRFASCHPNNNYHRKELTQEEFDLLKEVLL